MCEVATHVRANEPVETRGNILSVDLLRRKKRKGTRKINRAFHDRVCAREISNLDEIKAR